MDGIEYSTWFTTSTADSQGIMAFNLFSGETMWVINTTTNLRLGMIVSFEDPNEYGCDGPYIWTTGALPAADTGNNLIPLQSGSTQWNMYDGFTGNYIASIVNGTSPSLFTEDVDGNIIGYYFNSTVGTMGCGTASASDSPYGGRHVVETVTSGSGPALIMWNMTLAMGLTGTGISNWTPAHNAIWLFKNGIEWATNEPGNITAAEGGINLGVPGTYSASLTALTFETGNTLISLYNGIGLGDIYGSEISAAYDATTGAFLWAENFTNQVIGANLLPIFSRSSSSSQDYSAASGIYMEFDMASLVYVGFYAATGQVAYSGTLPAPTGQSTADPYDNYDICAQTSQATGVCVLCHWRRRLGHKPDDWSSPLELQHQLS